MKIAIHYIMQKTSNVLTEEVIELAELIWDYHRLNHTIEKADCIFVLGSHDPRVAERGAQLWLDGYAPLLIFSGGLGNFTKEIWTEPEADQFARIARDMGVPEEAILVENKSTNTGENLQFTHQLLAERGFTPASYIVVQKPNMERRAYATCRMYLPHQKLMVTSPQLSFREYPTEDIPMERVIHIMVGDLQRIREYPAMGFQIHQDIPEQVWNAWERLVELGFDGHLMR
ncbi:YdcF family protein [Telluribacter humicola]